MYILILAPIFSVLYYTPSYWHRTYVKYNLGPYNINKDSHKQMLIAYILYTLTKTLFKIIISEVNRGLVYKYLSFYRSRI